MKKKFITLALSMVLCLSMGMTALAAPSPTAPETTASEALAGFGGSNTSEQQRNLLNAIFKADSTVASLGTQIVKNTGTYNIDANSPLYNEKDGTITLPDVDAKSGETWIVLHLTDDGKGIQAVYKNVNIKDGNLVAFKTDNDFSPFMGVQLASTNPSNQTPSGTNQNGPGTVNSTAPGGASNSANGPASAGSDSTAAPKTGDFATPIVAEVVALLSVAGIALYVKKSAAR